MIQKKPEAYLKTSQGLARSKKTGREEVMGREGDGREGGREGETGGRKGEKARGSGQGRSGLFTISLSIIVIITT